MLTIVDPEQRINVTLTISESTTLSKIKATEEELKNKTVILDKLGKLRSVLTHFDAAKEALSDVRHLLSDHLPGADKSIFTDPSSSWRSYVSCRILDQGE